MDIKARLTELARIEQASMPVVSVYLNTRWADEHQRDRVRVFLKNEIRKARRSEGGRAADGDLDWIQSQGESLIGQARFPGARGAALFACQDLGLREVLPVRVPFEDAFVVAEGPFLRPLAALLDEAPAALVVFVDAESARLIPLTPAGAGDEVVLEAELVAHPHRGGWAEVAQAHYQRQNQARRGRHFEAVTESLVRLSEGRGLDRIVLAGEPRNLAVFRKHLPPRIAERVAGTVSGARHEAPSAIVARAADVVGHLEAGRVAGEVDAVLTEAAKSRQAVAGLEETLEAANRGAVHRLYVSKAFSEAGRVCGGCGALQTGAGPACRLCGMETRATELGLAMEDRVLAAGGTVQMVEVHRGLARVGGVAALLRYPL